MLSLHVPERLQALLQVVAGTDARDAGADDQDVQVFRRDASPLPRNTPPLAAGVPAAWRSRRGFCRVFSVRNVGDDRPRARRTWMLGVAAGGVAVTLATLAIRAPALHAKGGEAPRESAFATIDT